MQPAVLRYPRWEAFLPRLSVQLLHQIKDSLWKPLPQQAAFGGNQQKVTNFMQHFTTYPLKDFATARRFMADPGSFGPNILSAAMAQAYEEILDPSNRHAWLSFESACQKVEGASKLRIDSVLKSYNIFCDAISHSELKIPMPRDPSLRKRLVLLLIFRPNTNRCLTTYFSGVGDNGAQSLANNHPNDAPPPEIRPTPLRQRAPVGRPRPRAQRRPAFDADFVNRMATTARSRLSSLDAAQSIDDAEALVLLDTPAAAVLPDCLFCGQLLTEPVRYRECKHVRYFDRKCYKQLRKNKLDQPWACPFPGCLSRYTYAQLEPVPLDLAELARQKDAAALAALQPPAQTIHEID